MTSIEWTDATWLADRAVFKHQAVYHSGFHRPARRKRPFAQVAVALRTVARAARRNDVPWLGLAAGGNWHNVIPCGRGIRTVAAEPFEVFHQRFPRQYRNQLHSALTAAHVCLSAFPKGLVRGISAAVVSVPARLAHATAEARLWQPTKAPATPSDVQHGHSPALDVRRSWLHSDETAIATYVAASVSPRTVDSEVFEDSFASAFRALFHPFILLGEVPLGR